MSWADDFANLFGYQYAVCFARARDALAAYVGIRGKTILPSNICSVIAPYAKGFENVDETGLVPSLPVQLYGYRQEATGCLLELDPLMTGYKNKPQCESTIFSFGEKKMLIAGQGGMFLTNNQELAEKMEPHGFWNDAWNRPFSEAWHDFPDELKDRWERIAEWDSELGNRLIRIGREQVMPWRVMRRVPNGKRDILLDHLQAIGVAVNKHYAPIEGNNEWGDSVINFSIDKMPDNWGVIIETIEEVVHG